MPSCWSRPRAIWSDRRVRRRGQRGGLASRTADPVTTVLGEAGPGRGPPPGSSTSGAPALIVPRPGRARRLCRARPHEGLPPPSPTRPGDLSAICSSHRVFDVGLAGRSARGGPTNLPGWNLPDGLRYSKDHGGLASRTGRWRIGVPTRQDRWVTSCSPAAGGGTDVEQALPLLGRATIRGRHLRPGVRRRCRGQRDLVDAPPPLNEDPTVRWLASSSPSDPPSRLHARRDGPHAIEAMSLLNASAHLSAVAASGASSLLASAQGTCFVSDPFHDTITRRLHADALSR